jgi:hypothetical protein
MNEGNKSSPLGIQTFVRGHSGIGAIDDTKRL